MIICTICARGGSKGVKNKNIRFLQGKPMIAHTIEHALKANIFSAVAVSSDSEEILRSSKEWGATHLILRPLEMATDQAPKLQAIQHAVLETEKMLGELCNVSVDLDASAPVRTSNDILGAMNVFQEKQADNVITGVRSRKSPYFNLVEEDKEGVVDLAKKPMGAVVRRQDVPPTYDMNASIYIWKREVLLSDKGLFGPRTFLFEMSEDSAYDVDTEMDFKIVEMILKEKFSQKE